jgi:hypothetical protein
MCRTGRRPTIDSQYSQFLTARRRRVLHHASAPKSATTQEQGYGRRRKPTVGSQAMAQAPEGLPADGMARLNNCQLSMQRIRLWTFV